MPVLLAKTHDCLSIDSQGRTLKEREFLAVTIIQDVRKSLISAGVGLDRNLCEP
jgi:hypothetical protein